MIEVDWNPDTKKLRSFGWFALAGFNVFGAVVALKTGAFKGEATFLAPLILSGTGVACAFFAAIWPPALRPIYLVLTAIALPIGLVVSNVLLALLFYGIFTPIAVFFRLRGRDALHRKLEPGTDSYWIKPPKPRPAEDYYRQF